MEKLTHKVNDMFVLVESDYQKLLDVDDDEWKKLDKVIQKLGKYEDLEEQGLLLKLPCKIGDIVYVIPSKVNYGLNILHNHKENNRVYQQIVKDIRIYANGSYYLSTCDGTQCVISQFYKIYWFLTHEEAEKALEEMKYENN